MKAQTSAIILSILAFITAVALANMRHESRLLFGQIQKLENARDELNVEWYQLQLEQSTLATGALLDKEARERLEMVVPDPSAVVYLQP